MKAIEYYDLYVDKFFGELISPEEASITARQILIDFSKEIESLCEIRHVKFDSGMASLVREQNQKWNALCGIFTRKHGFSPLIENGFKKFWEDKIPELIRYDLMLPTRERKVYGS